MTGKRIPVRMDLGMVLVALWALGAIPLPAGDLEEAIRAVVRVRATVPPEAITARTLGTERQGNGILIDSEGLVLTIGYLIVEADGMEVHSAAGGSFRPTSRATTPTPALVCSVPIDLLKPILQELMRSGRSGLPPRPWLGLNAAEIGGRVVVTVVTPGGPAEQAGLGLGDVILEVEGQPAAGVAESYRCLWATGPAGVSVRLRILRRERTRELSVQSADRNERYRSRPARPGGVASAAQGR